MALLDETPLPVVVKAVAEAATPDVPAKKIMKHLKHWATEWQRTIAPVSTRRAPS
jgi:ABC-type thiamine transport system substrate-binding protein